ncbi:MAG: (S)-ureidoglycine aminohydrolase [Planctomycetota bacterium]
MSQTPLGSTRTHVRADHAVIGPDGHVSASLHGWRNTEGVMLVSPAMGAAGGIASRGPGFAMYLAQLSKESSLQPTDSDVERLIYVLAGELEAGGKTLGPESYLFLPPGDDCDLSIRSESRALVFEKRYVPLLGTEPPGRLIGHLADCDAAPFMGDENARLACLLPDQVSFDMAVNVFTFDPGTPLPFVETHVMEHGLFMSKGQGIYRLSDQWYPVTKGDAIWMAAYCPQWFVAMGKSPAQYIYYKDMHRSHLAS